LRAVVRPTALQLCGAQFNLPKTVGAGYKARSCTGVPRHLLKEFPVTDFSAVQANFTAIATAHADYAKASMEASKSYFEKLATVKSPQTFLELTTEYTKSAYETFVADATKISELYKAAFQPVSVKI
jgi:hypothetical protein